MALRVLSYFIVLFPSIDVISVYPLIILAMVNNIYTLVFGKDYTKTPKTWFTFFIRVMMKLIAAILPILVAMGVSNLVKVSRYAGLTGFFISFFIPTLLQLCSQWACKKRFEASLAVQRELRDAASFANNNTTNNNSATVGTYQVKSSITYMTPYSTIFSHWHAVIVLGGMGVVLFLLTMAGLPFPS